MAIRPSIRAVEPSDVPALDVLRRQAVAAACRGLSDPESYVDVVAEPGDELGDQVADDGFRALLVETEVTPVSYGVLELPGDGPARLRALYTSPDHGGEGYATTLLDRLVEAADAAGATAVRATVPSVSVGFFERREFDCVGDGKWHGLPAAVLERPV